MTIAIATPTGTIGRQITHHLLDAGDHDLLLLARKPDKLEAEIARGARVAQGDLRDPTYLTEATEGVDALFLLIPSSVTSDDAVGRAVAFAEAAVAAIRANAIPHVVLLSSIGAHLDAKTGPIYGLHKSEHLLRETDAALTILRPAYFMENFFGSLQSIAEHGAIFQPIRPDASTPMIATQDIAAVAATHIAEPNAAGVRINPLHGPRDYTFAEAADAIGRGLGRNVNFVQVTPEQAKEGMLAAGMSEHMAEQYIEMSEAMSTGTLEPEFPRTDASTTPTTLETFARTTLAPALQQHA